MSFVSSCRNILFPVRMGSTAGAGTGDLRLFYGEFSPGLTFATSLGGINSGVVRRARV